MPSYLKKVMKKIYFFSKQDVYATLYQLGLKCMTVPATSTSIERVFSQSGFLTRSHRASLTTKNVCLLTFLKCNKVLFRFSFPKA